MRGRILLVSVLLLFAGLFFLDAFAPHEIEPVVRGDEVCFVEKTAVWGTELRETCVPSG